MRARRRPGVRHLAPDERYDVLLLVSIIVVDVVARRRRPGDGPRVPLLAALELGLYSVARLEAHHLSWKRRDAKRVDELHAEALGRREAPVGDGRHVHDAGRAGELAAPAARQDQLLGVRHERVFRLAAAEVAQRQVVQARVHHSRRLERRRQVREGRADHARVGHEGEDAARLAREAVEDLVVQGVAEAERVDRDVADVLL